MFGTVVFILFLSWCSQTDARYLNDLPNYLQPCKVSDTVCLTQTMQNIFIQLRSGIPGLTNITNIELQESDKIQVNINQTELIDVSITLTKGVVLGLSDVIVKNALYNEKRGTMSFDIKYPRLRMLSDYEVEGQILNFDIDARNKLSMDLDNSDAQIKILTDLMKQDGEQFLLVQDVKIKFGKINRTQTFFKDLMKNNKTIASQVDEEFKKHVKELNRALLPLIEETARDILKTVLRRVFRFIPVKFLFSNL